MTQPKKLSRRDAIKLLGAAAGATVLANLPSKWSKPQLATGVLPAHAQTSTSLLLTIINGGFSQLINQKRRDAADYEIGLARGFVAIFDGSHFVEISEKIANIPLILVTKSTNLPTWISPLPSPDGEYLTNANGIVNISITVQLFSDLDFVWTFKNPSDGVDMKTFTLSANWGLDNDG